MRYEFVAALFASAYAVKHSATVSQADATTGAFTPTEMSFDAIVGSGELWFNTVIKPFLEENAPKIRDTVESQMALQYGEPLYPVCSMGQACREGQWETYHALVKEAWADVLLAFRGDVEATKIKTESLLMQYYTESKECELNDNCCTFPEETYGGVIEQIEYIEKLIAQKRSERLVIDGKRRAIETECPDFDYQPLWDQYFPGVSMECYFS